jgi:hypothetical protein
MRYRIEYDDDNQDLATFHLDTDLLKFAPKPEKGWTPERDESDFYDNDAEVPFFVNRLLMMKGVEEVHFFRYSLKITKGSIFSWRDLSHRIIEDLQVSLNKGEQAQRTRHRYTRSSKKALKSKATK